MRVRWLTLRLIGIIYFLGIIYFSTKLPVETQRNSIFGIESTNMPFPQPQTTSCPLRIATRIPRQMDTVKEICSACYQYDVTINGSGFDYPCVQMSVKPSTPICLYPKERDVWISGAFWKNKIWEGALLNVLKNKIARYPDMGFIDLGANIGAFTLPIAAMGHKVLAVDPNIENVRRLHKAISLGMLADKVTILVNAVSNMRGISRIMHNADNQGGVPVQQVNMESEKDYDQENYTKSILMDDLLPFCKFKEAIMKVDIEGSESKAFSHADRLLENINIPYIQMEWHVDTILQNVNDSNAEYGQFSSMVDFFVRRGYSPRPVYSIKPFNSINWLDWPPDILWTKKGY